MTISLLRSVTTFYERYENLGLKVTFVLVSLQVVHLYWLTTFVILDAPQLTLGIPPLVFAVIDYLEVPSLILGSVFYITQLSISRKNVIYLSMLLTQFYHIIWVTDTFVYMAFNFNQMVWLAWLAIIIDYAEVPVIYDLFRKLYSSRK